MRTAKFLQTCGMRKKDARVLRKIGLRRWREMFKSDNQEPSGTDSNVGSKAEL